MRELTDCHIHTARCGHAQGSVDDYVVQAVARGLSGIAITEHLALPEHLDPHQRLSMPELELVDYIREIDVARSAHPNIHITTGLEVDYLPENVANTKEAIRDARSRGVRVILGSVHFIGDWAFDDPEHLNEWATHDVDAAWVDYFGLWADAVRTGLFDVMAHPDLVKKFGHFPSFDTAEIFHDCAEVAAEAGVAVEVSTAGLRKPVAEIYPGQKLLGAFQSAGVPVTVGSDAHCPSEVGYRLDAAHDALRAAGYVSSVFPRQNGDWKEYSL